MSPELTAWNRAVARWKECMQFIRGIDMNDDIELYLRYLHASAKLWPFKSPDQVARGE